MAKNINNIDSISRHHDSHHNFVAFSFPLPKVEQWHLGGKQHQYLDSHYNCVAVLAVTFPLPKVEQWRLNQLPEISREDIAANFLFKSVALLPFYKSIIVWHILIKCTNTFSSRSSFIILCHIFLVDHAKLCEKSYKYRQ